MRRTTFGVLTIAAGAAALAVLSRLHHDLAIDEPFTALAVAAPASLATTVVHDNVPAFYLLLLAWTRVFGATPVALRALSAAAFAAAIVFTAAAAWRVSSGRAAWLAAFLVACSVPFGLGPAATVRPYALVLLWSAAALWASLRAEDTASSTDAALPLLASHLLGLFTHPVFVFVSVASAAAGLMARRRRALLAVVPLAGVAVYGAVWWPVLERTAALPSRAWMHPPHAREVAAGALFWGDHATLVLAAAMAVAVAARWRRVDGNTARRVGYAAVVAALTIAGAIAASRLTPVYFAQRTPVFVLPAVALMFAVTLAELLPASLAAALALMLAVSAARYTMLSMRQPDPHPTRASLAAVAAGAACGDTIVATGLSYAPVVYYASAARVPACVRIEPFPAEMRAHPGWMDVSPDENAAASAAAVELAGRLPASGSVRVLMETDGIGAEVGRRLSAALAAERPSQPVTPLRGSFFDSLAVFGGRTNTQQSPTARRTVYMLRSFLLAEGQS